MSYSVTEVQPTPNPNAMKYVLDRPVSTESVSFFNAEAATTHPLATRLFEVEGVSSLLLLKDFITINKRPEANWADVTKKVKKILKAG